MKRATLFSTGIFALCCLISSTLFAQQGKNGAGSITVANTIVNSYTRLSANASAGNTSITVLSSAGIAAGDLVFIIQMYGADVNAYTDPFNNNRSLPEDTSYGKIVNYNNAGLNEFQQVNAVPNGTTINLDCGLKNNYTAIKMVQVIKVPRYTTLSVTAPGSITCPAWNGSTGGVVVVEVQGNTTLSASPSINANALGFRGGMRKSSTGYGATNSGTWWPENGAVKGEGIVGDTTYYHNTFSGSLAKGNVANAGGGGNAMNCGGGGGSNGGIIANWNGMGNPDMSTTNNINSWALEPTVPIFGSFRPTSSSGGGRGGYAFSSNSSAGSANPTVTGPDNTAVWGSDSRHNDGGWGGIPLDYSTGRMYMGGGGGAGDDNDGNGSSGGNGGGIVYIMSYGTVSGAGTIVANGATALNTNWNTTPGKCGDDGAGGGGGGGAVFVNSVGAITLTNATPISAIGGNGGSYQYHCLSTTKDFGPGGGGGGGYVGTSNAVTSNVNGGTNGICVLGGGNNSQIAQKFPPNGATAGGVGSTGAVTNFYLTTTNYTICAGTAASLSVTIGGTPPGGIAINWYNVNVGGTPIGTGNPYSTGPLAVGTYTYYAGTCPGTYRSPVVVTVLSAPTVSVTASPTVICSGGSTTLTASGATNYTWSANAGSATTSTVSVSPGVPTTYTVTGANGTCTNTQTISVNVNTTPSLTTTASPTVICSGGSTTLTASGATNYTWSANAGSATTSTVSVSPGAPTTYTVTGSNGGCLSTQTISVNVNTTPTLTTTASPTVICSGGSTILTASGATNYTWSANAGSATTATVSVSPGVPTTYTVTGANGTCVSTKTISVNVTATPTVAISASPTVICSGNSTVLTASGATNYTWSANAGSATTSTVSVSPGSPTTYTVTGANGTCTSTQTISVNVTTTPTVAASASPTVICSGNSTVLTASGATNYTWSANAGSATTSTVSVSPGSPTTYTVTGANGTCTSTQTISVNVTTTPTVAASASPTVICSGNPTVLTASGATNYTWSANAGSATTSTVSVSPGGPTTYTVIGANGTCTSTQTVSVNVNTTPTVSINANPASICTGQSTVLTASGASSYTWSANAGGATTSTVSVTPGSTTTYTVTGDNGGCVNTETVSITVGSAPSLSITATNTVICSGQSVVLTANGATTYTWSANAGSATTSTVSVSPGTNQTYTVTGDNAGCIGTQTIAVSVGTTPTVVTSVSPTVICSGQSTVLTAGGATSYTWSANAGSATTSTVSVSPGTSDTYTVIGETGGCTSTETVAVTVNAAPTITITATPAVICNGGSTTLSGTGASTYTWSANAGSATTSTVTVSPAITTSYTLTGDNGSGCLSTQIISVIVNNGPTDIDSAITAAACGQTNGSFTLTAVNGGSPNYQINFNNTGFSAIGSFPYTVGSLGAGIYPVVIQDNNGCTYTTSVNITNIGGITSVSNTTQNAMCKPANSGVIILTGVTGGTGPYQVSVNGGPLTNIVSFPDSLKNLAAGSYTVLVQDASGCINTQVVNVGGQTGPSSATSSTTNDTCNNSNGSLTVSGVTGGTPGYQYSLNGGPLQGTGVFTGLANGNYTVTVEDANGCTYTLTDSVGLTTVPSPTVTAQGPTTFCQGGSVVLTSSSANGNTWSTSATTQTISINGSGTYSVSVTVSGCTVASNTIAVVVNPTPTVSVNSGTICQGSSTTLTAAGASTYTWSPATGLSSANGSPVTANPGSTTVYTVDATDANGCTTSNTTTVTVNPTPSSAPGLSPDTLFYCLYQTVPSLTATTTGGATLNWYDQNNVLLPTAPTPSTNILGATTYYATQSLGICEGPRDSIVVIIVPGPSAVFTSNPATGSIIIGQSVVFTPTQQYPFYVYSWDFGDPTSTSNTSTVTIPSHAYTAAGLYCTQLVIVSLQTGCADSTTQCLDVLGGVTITIPNVFSPNDDHINDVFSIKTEGVSTLKCEIYDRWGLKLYGWDGITGYWDGKTNGKQCSEGTYYYVVTVVDVKGKEQTFNGYLTLVK